MISQVVLALCLLAAVVSQNSQYNDDLESIIKRLQLSSGSQPSGPLSQPMVMFTEVKTYGPTPVAVIVLPLASNGVTQNSQYNNALDSIIKQLQLLRSSPQSVSSPTSFSSPPSVSSPASFSFPLSVSSPTSFPFPLSVPSPVNVPGISNLASGIDMLAFDAGFMQNSQNNNQYNSIVRLLQLLQPSPESLPSPQSDPSTQTLFNPRPPSFAFGRPSSIASGIPSSMASRFPSNMVSEISASMAVDRPSSVTFDRPLSVTFDRPSSLTFSSATSMASGGLSNLVSGRPSSLPNNRPLGSPFRSPTSMASGRPTSLSSGTHSTLDFGSPTSMSSGIPSNLASGRPSSLAFESPSSVASGIPSNLASGRPSSLAFESPTSVASGISSNLVSGVPSSLAPERPSSLASGRPASLSFGSPSSMVPGRPTSLASVRPTSMASIKPSKFTSGSSSDSASGSSSNFASAMETQSSDGDPLFTNDVNGGMDIRKYQFSQEPQNVETPQRQGCGWSFARGIENNTSDREAQYGEFPWTCAVLRTKSETNEKTGEVNTSDVFVCNGALIHPSVVLTYDYFPSSKSPGLKVRAGVIRNTEGSVGLHQLREVETVERLGYPYYSLLFLTEPMTLTPNVGVACLPPQDQELPPATSCVATRWDHGRSVEYNYQDKLQKVGMCVMDRASCERSLIQTGRYSENYKLDQWRNCVRQNAVGSRLSEKMCDDWKWDSPLSCSIESNDDRYMLSGILWGGERCESDPFWLFRDISALRMFIDEKVTAMGYDPNIYTIDPQ